MIDRIINRIRSWWSRSEITELSKQMQKLRLQHKQVGDDVVLLTEENEQLKKQIEILKKQNKLAKIKHQTQQELRDVFEELKDQKLI